MVTVFTGALAVALLLIWVWRGKHVCLSYSLTNSSQTEYTDVVLSVGTKTYSMGLLRHGDERSGSVCCGVADHWGLRLSRVDAGVSEFVFLDGVYVEDDTTQADIVLQEIGVRSSTSTSK